MIKFILKLLFNIFWFFAKHIFLFFLYIFLIIFMAVGIFSESEQEEIEYNTIIFNASNISEDKNKSILDEDNMSFLELINKLKAMAKDDTYTTMILDLDNTDISTNMIEEITPLIEEIKKEHNVYAYGTNIYNKDYSLALLADEIYMYPSYNSLFNLEGYSQSTMYYKNILDKYGVNVNVIHIGDYKSFGEEYNLTHMSKENRENTERMLDNRLNKFITKIAEKRNIKEETVKEDILSGRLVFTNPYIAKEKGYINNVIAEEEVYDINNAIDIYQYNYKKEINEKKIVVINAEGNIGSENIEEKNITYDNIEKKIEKLRKIDNVEGVVLRINSPGGSALESHKIYSLLENLDLPIYVSMGSVAASGGYYIAMAGEKVFADESTITGSIGVVSMVIKTDKLLNKFDINIDRIEKGKNAGLFDPNRPLNAEEVEVIRNGMNDLYIEFKDIVTKNRGIKSEELEKLASGRVWLGDEAKSNGLIDEIGGLDDTIKALASDYHIDSYSVEEIVLPVDYTEIFEKAKKYIKVQLTGNVLGDIEKQYRFLQENNAKMLYYLPK